MSSRIKNSPFLNVSEADDFLRINRRSPRGSASLVEGYPAGVSLTLAGTIGLGPAMFARTEPVVVWNGTPSVGNGFYLIRAGPLRKGDPVLVRLALFVRRFIRHSGYLLERLLLEWPGIAVALSRDGIGRKLPVCRGCLDLGEDEMFLLSRLHVHSMGGTGALLTEA